MKKISFLATAAMLMFNIQSNATRVTHTYADGSIEVYYTDMDCSEVNGWVSQHPEWQGIVSCDPEVIIAPPTGGTISVNSVKVEVSKLNDFSGWTTPKGNAAPGYIDRITTKQASVSSPNNSNSYFIAGIAAVLGIGIGFVVGKKRKG